MAARHDSSDDDPVLVDAARAGDRPAFESLVRRYQRPIYFLCLRYVRDHDDAADLAQRTFVRALGNLAELRTSGVFRTWLYRIAVNLALNHLRDHARFVDTDGAEMEPHGGTAAPEAPALMEAAERAAELRALVASLPTKQRLTMELRIYDDLSFREIADVLDTSEGAAKVNFHYAVRRLRGLLLPANAKDGKGHDDAS